MKLRRPAIALLCAVALVLVLMALVPVSRTAFNFSRLRAGAEGTQISGGRTIAWAELMHPDWDPVRDVRRFQDQARFLQDSDPEAVEMLARAKRLFYHSPTNPALEGANVRIPGYVLPLERSKQGLHEFLLVPYFGACIHSPPPPANQVVRVVLSKPASNLRSMDSVWVTGRLHQAHSDAGPATSGWTLKAGTVERYR